MLNSRFDLVGLAREKRLDEAVRRIRRLAELGSAAAQEVPEPQAAPLSPEQTLDAMYECAVEIRMDLIYCPVLSGHLRKRWSNRIGEINLQGETAAAEIHHLRDDLAAYEAACDDTIAVDVADIRRRLWQLRDLCLRHQAMRKSFVG
jgi:hypothetical protein